MQRGRDGVGQRDREIRYIYIIERERESEREREREKISGYNIPVKEKTK